MRFVLTGFPMPPSANALYARGMFKGKAKTWKSDLYTAFLKRANQWTIKNNDVLVRIRRAVQTAALNGTVLKVDTYFIFQRDEIWCQLRKQPKRKFKTLPFGKEELPLDPIYPKPKILDASNRIKAAHDCLCTAIGRDDLYFWAGHYEKAEASLGEGNQVIFVITEYSPRTAKDIIHEVCPQEPGNTGT